MSKSFFVMDTPSCCGECKMSGTGVCRRWNMKNLKTFPEDCPLKKVPERKSYEALSDANPVKAWGNGWNACIEEILK